MKRVHIILILLAVAAGIFAADAQTRRRMTPVDTPATTTQAVNETANDTARINARRRANSVSYLNDNGQTVYVDTITGMEWMDSTLINKVPKMEFPLFHAVTVGVNVWDPLMRAFGQHYGIADAWAELSLHNRYKPIVEVGLGKADYTPSGSNFTYRSPMSVYFRMGINYNFLYNSNPDYSFVAGVRYGLAPFTYSIDNVTVDSPYWDETSTFNIPSTKTTVGWFEFCLGLRVKIWGPVSAGWTVKYQSILHSGKAPYGKPYYIPGYGSRNAPVSGSFSVSYTFGIERLNKHRAPDVDMTETPVSTEPETNTIE